MQRMTANRLMPNAAACTPNNGSFRTTASAAPNPAPEVAPKRSGDAMAFLYSPWNVQPETESAPTTTNAQMTLGRRICSSIVAFCADPASVQPNMGASSMRGDRATQHCTARSPMTVGPPVWWFRQVSAGEPFSFAVLPSCIHLYRIIHICDAIPYKQKPRTSKGNHRIEITIKAQPTYAYGFSITASCSLGQFTVA